MSRYKIYTTTGDVYHTDVLDMERLASEVMIVFVPKNGPTRGKRTFCFRENITLIEDSEMVVEEDTIPVWVIGSDGSIEIQGLPLKQAPNVSQSLENILGLIKDGEMVPMDAWETWLNEDR